MKPTLLTIVGVSILIASVLTSCAPASPLIPVTGNQAAVIPDTVASARDLSLGYIAGHYALPELPQVDTWRSSEVARPDLVDLKIYQFKSGSWLVTVRRPALPMAALEVTCIDTGSDFVWSGTVDSLGMIVENSSRQ